MQAGGQLRGLGVGAFCGSGPGLLPSEQSQRGRPSLTRRCSRRRRRPSSGFAGSSQGSSARGRSFWVQFREDRCSRPGGGPRRSVCLWEALCAAPPVLCPQQSGTARPETGLSLPGAPRGCEDLAFLVSIIQPWGCAPPFEWKTPQNTLPLLHHASQDLALPTGEAAAGLRPTPPLGLAQVLSSTSANQGKPVFPLSSHS